MKHCLLTTSATKHLNRRQFLRSVARLGLSAAGLALLDACASSPATPISDYAALETTTIRLYKNSSICPAPQYLAQEALKAEGFTEVQYIETNASDKTLISGDVDIGQAFAASILPHIEAEAPLVILSGVHIGCFELFGTEQLNTISELKGKTTAVQVLGGPQHMFLSSILAYVGLNPNTDINWVVAPTADEQARSLADGKVDVVLAFPPAAQNLRAKKIGHVILNSMMDSPWSQYFCCMVAANREFVRQNPVATKRALRALLKATDIAAHEPERVARFLVQKGYTKNYDYALDAMQHIPYNKWREYDPADTLRFYALRLRDAGLLLTSPDDIIARGTDWRFLNELKQELSAPAASVRNDGLLCHLGQRG